MHGVSAPHRIVLSTRTVRAHAGSSRIVLALVRSCAAAGHRVEVVADRLDAAAVRAAGGIPRYPLGNAWLQGLGRLLLDRERLLALRAAAVRRARADLVVGEGDIGRQDVLVVHNIIRREVEALGRAATSANEQAARAQEDDLQEHAFRLVIANSELTRREFARCFRCPAGRVAVVRPGHDPAQFSLRDRAMLRDTVRRDLGLAAQDMLVAFVSSGHFQLRGVEVLVATLAQLPPAVTTHLRLLGVGSERNTRLLRDALVGAGSRVTVIGRPPLPAIERYYHAADLLFHPALFETFGLVVEEAAACGTPVLTSRAVGAAELFDGDGALAVAPAPDPVLFAPLLARLLLEPALRQAVADSQRRAVKARTWPVYAAEFMAACGIAPGLAAESVPVTAPGP